ncbi:MarR family winged helix-turn-helix transcriptional regulator [Haloimpatiens sp. FM7330]|uniref:MarR family winged helix-turn-helix transcriptional regulator n=1 Tax=Haloimpatiens sp. FM7330 TaxID=3298610 RepID=UPI00363AAF58
MKIENTDFFERTYRIINKYNHKTKKPKSYGTEHLLYSSEVHMIEVIGHHSALTSTQIATLQGVTKGAVSQTVSKLQKKGLIYKSVSSNGNNEILITLSDTGKIIYQNHLKFHKNLISQLSILADELTPESTATLQKMLNVIEETLDNN